MIRTYTLVPLPEDHQAYASGYRYRVVELVENPPGQVFATEAEAEAFVKGFGEIALVTKQVTAVPESVPSEPGPFEQWQAAVANRDTTLSYIDWARNQA